MGLFSPLSINNLLVFNMYTGRIYTISDLHVDQKANMEWVENLSDNNYSWDTLIVAGDITHDIRKLFHTLRILREKFREVYFCPGSHELWIVGEDDKKKYGISNSIEKFHYVSKQHRNFDFNQFLFQ